MVSVEKEGLCGFLIEVKVTLLILVSPFRLKSLISKYLPDILLDHDDFLAFLVDFLKINITIALFWSRLIFLIKTFSKDCAFIFSILPLALF